MLLSCFFTLTQVFVLYFFSATAPTRIYTLSLHDALPIFRWSSGRLHGRSGNRPECRSSIRSTLSTAPSTRSAASPRRSRSEEHTSELQSPCNLVCRLLLDKKNKCQAV